MQQPNGSPSRLKEHHESSGRHLLHKLLDSLNPHHHSHQSSSHDSHHGSHSSVNSEEGTSTDIKLKRCEVHDKSVCGLLIDTRGHLISCSDDCTIKVWSLANGECLKVFNGHKHSVNALVMLNKDQLISASTDRSWKCWDLDTGKCVKTVTSPNEQNIGIYSLALTNLPGGEIATGSYQIIEIFDLESETCVQTLDDQHQDYVNALVVDPSTNYLISGSSDGLIVMWEMTSGEALRSLNAGSKVTSLALLDRVVVSGAEDSKLTVWNIDSGQLIRKMSGHKGCVNALIADEKAKRLISASDDGTIKIWSALDGSCVKTLCDHESNESSHSLVIRHSGAGSPNKSSGQLISGYYSGIIKFWKI